MLTTDDKTFLRDVLQPRTEEHRLPIVLYEAREEKRMEGILRVGEEFFPSHCQAIWKLNGGQGKQMCDRDMCGRADKVLNSGQKEQHYCHAGLTNITEPLKVDDKSTIVIQYGALILVGEDEVARKRRLDRHEAAMIKLKASDEEKAHIRSLLLDETTPRRKQAALDQLQARLASDLGIINKYINQRTLERRIQEKAYHDLQMRVTAVAARAENLQKAVPADWPLREELEDLLGAADGANMVFHSLTRGRYLTESYRFRSYYIKEFVNQAVRLCRAEARDRGVEWDVDLQPANGEVIIKASKIHLEVALNNLVHNAVKYSYRKAYNSDRRYVSIKGKIARSGYEVDISNYGVGILPDEKDKIFEEGYQGELTRLEYRSGSGQGLPIAKEIIKRHNGDISMTSLPRGDSAPNVPRPYLTHFVLRLPFHQPPQE